ncbi:MAG: hypothetical protein GY788_22970, partial [bacterium]|nr:hypothetical protein [bacterium]
GAMRYEFLSYLTDESDVWSDRRELGLTVRSYRTSPGDAAALAMARLQDGTALPYLIYHAVWTRHLWEAAWSMCTVVTEPAPSPHAAPTRAQRANLESRDDSGEDLLTKAGGILVSGLVFLYAVGVMNGWGLDEDPSLGDRLLWPVAMVTDDDSSGGGGDSGPVAVGSCVSSIGLVVPCSVPHAGRVVGWQLLASQCPLMADSWILAAAGGVWCIDSDT